MMQKIYLTTGEFAKLCHTTKHTLFHYCDIGLFSPAYTDENGYRYYHVLQYDTFMTIANLRTVGMSLEEIREYLQERSPEHMVALYEKQEKRIAEQLRQLRQIKSAIRSQKEKLQQVLECTEEFFLESQPRECLHCSQWITRRDDYAMTAAVGDLAAAKDREKTTPTAGMLCKLSEGLCEENYPICFYITEDTEENADHQKQAGTYLCTFHYGDYESLAQTFRKLADYAKKENLELDDWVYAQTIVGDWAALEPQQYIVKLCVRVKDSLQA